MNKKLYVNQIFESVQGEGFHTGRLAIFIRFAGCNLRCDFCDTKYAWEKESGRPYSPKQLLASLKSREYVAASQVTPFGDKAPRANPIKFVVLTGGEPMLQDFQMLSELIRKLKRAGYYVAIESNGTMAVDRRTLKLDWITISPKSEEPFWIFGDELKLLYDGTQDLEYYEQFKEFKYFYLQPILPEDKFVMTDKKRIEVLGAFEKVLNAVKKRGPWRVSFQTHKLVGWA